jgi:hypothetical protein
MTRDNGRQGRYLLHGRKRWQAEWTKKGQTGRRSWQVEETVAGRKRTKRKFPKESSFRERARFFYSLRKPFIMTILITPPLQLTINNRHKQKHKKCTKIT